MRGNLLGQIHAQSGHGKNIAIVPYSRIGELANNLGVDFEIPAGFADKAGFLAGEYCGLKVYAVRSVQTLQVVKYRDLDVVNMDVELMSMFAYLRMMGDKI